MDEWSEEIGGGVAKVIAISIIATILCMGAFLLASIVGPILSFWVLVNSWRRTSMRVKLGAILLPLIGASLLLVSLPSALSPSNQNWHLVFWLVSLLLVVSPFVSLGMMALAYYRDNPSLFRQPLLTMSRPASSPAHTIGKRCTQCGAGNPPEYTFCGKCGASQRPPSTPMQNRRCPTCNTINPITYNFCGTCGGNLGVLQPLA